MFAIEKEGILVGVASCHQEFSDWRFGIVWYLGQLFLNEVDANLVIAALIRAWNDGLASELKAVVLRVIFFGDIWK